MSNPASFTVTKTWSHRSSMAESRSALGGASGANGSSEAAIGHVSAVRAIGDSS